MSHNAFYIPAVIALVVVTSVALKSADAQQDNRPFSFNNGPGMSLGGQQAIINQKLFNLTPDNLHRDSSGLLLDVMKGPGNSALATVNGTNSFLPGYRGTGFRGDNSLMQAGAFNPYFAPHYGGSAYNGYNYDYFQTAAIINAWTMNVVNHNIASEYYSPSNPIDFWTGYVYGMQNK